MTAEIIFGTDFHARRDREAAELHALSQAMAPDVVFVDIGPDIFEDPKAWAKWARMNLPFPAQDKDSA